MMYGYGYGPMMGGGGWFVGIFMLFFWLAVVGGLALLVIWAVRSASHGHGHPAGPPSVPQHPGHDEAMAIARKRLASGEITPEQFEELRRTLGG